MYKLCLRLLKRVPNYHEFDRFFNCRHTSIVARIWRYGNFSRCETHS